MSVIYSSLNNIHNKSNSVISPITYDTKVENYINIIENDLSELLPPNKKYLSRWIALKLLDENTSINDALKTNFNIDINTNIPLHEKMLKIKSQMDEDGFSLSSLRDSVVSSIVHKAEEIRCETCSFENAKYNLKNTKIDKILTSKKFGIPIMIIFLALIFWLTITGANYPSSLLSNFFGYIQDKLLILFNTLHIPDFLTNILIYRYVSNSYLGSFCYVTSYGNIFSFIYFARRFRIFAKDCI